MSVLDCVQGQDRHFGALPTFNVNTNAFDGSLKAESCCASLRFEATASCYFR